MFHLIHTAWYVCANPSFGLFKRKLTAGARQDLSSSEETQYGNIQSFMLITTNAPSAWTSSSSWMSQVFAYTSFNLKKSSPLPKLKIRILRPLHKAILDIVITKCFIFGEYKEKVWHPHYQIALKRHSSSEKGNTRNKRWPVNKPSHIAAGILSLQPKAGFE